MADDLGYLIQQVDDDVGRGMFATRRFAKGETVLAETPLVSCQFAWNAAYGYRACHLCLAPLETAEENARRLSNDPSVVLPHTAECCLTRPAFHVECEQCPAAFCSQECRRDAWDRFHKTLCLGSKQPDPNHPLVRLMEMWRNLHFPPETTTVELVARILASVVQAPDPDAETAKLMSFVHSTTSSGACGDTAGFSHKLLGPEFYSQLEMLRLATSEVFSGHPAVSHLLLPDQFASLFALLGRNGQGLATSAFSVWVRGVEKLKLRDEERQSADKLIDELYEAIEAHVCSSFMDNEGSGLFELQSMINHSCEPNAEVAYPFNSHRCVVNVTRAVEPGEQILISYLNPGDMERSRHSRRKILRENYLFDCGCVKCESQAADPDETSEEEMDDDDEEEEEEEGEEGRQEGS